MVIHCVLTEKRSCPIRTGPVNQPIRKLPHFRDHPIEQSTQSHVYELWRRCRRSWSRNRSEQGVGHASPCWETLLVVHLKRCRVRHMRRALLVHQVSQSPFKWKLEKTSVSTWKERELNSFPFGLFLPSPSPRSSRPGPEHFRSLFGSVPFRHLERI